DCVAVLIPIGKACENENGWILHGYYASRNNVPRSSLLVKRRIARFLHRLHVISAGCLPNSTQRGNGLAGALCVQKAPPNYSKRAGCDETASGSKSFQQAGSIHGLSQNGL